MTPVDLPDEEMLHPRQWSAAFKRHKLEEIARRWESGAYAYQGGRRDLAWDVGIPYTTLNKWLRQSIKSHRRPPLAKVPTRY